MQFVNLIGQEKIKKELISAASSDRVGHALLFTGPGGIGKKSFGAAYGALLLCENPVSGHTDSCGCCRSCTMLREGTHPDWKVVEAQKSSLGVDQIRYLQQDVYIKPMYGGKKVYMIIEADQMTEQAQNALLKTLEEPPEYAVFILTTAYPLKLLPTIRSRVKRLDFSLYTRENMKKFIQHTVDRIRREKGELPDVDEEIILSYAEGVPGTALKLIGDSGFYRLREKTLEIAEGLLKGKAVNPLNSLDFFLENKDRIDQILDIMELFYRDIAVYIRLGENPLLINVDKKDKIRMSASDLSFERMSSILHQVENARKQLEQNINYEIAVEVMLLNIQEEPND